MHHTPRAARTAGARTRPPLHHTSRPRSLARPGWASPPARGARARSWRGGAGGGKWGTAPRSAARRRRTRVALPERSFWLAGRACDKTHGGDDAVARVRLLGAADETARSV